MNLSTESNFNAWEQYSINLTDSCIKHLLGALNKPTFFDSSDYSLNDDSNFAIKNDKKDVIDIISGNPSKEITLDKSCNKFPQSISQLCYPPNIIKVPFSAGYIGFIKYEYGNSLLNIETNKANDDQNSVKNYYIGLYTWSIVRKNKHALITFSPLCPPEERQIIKDILESSSENHLANASIQTEKNLNWALSSSKIRYTDQLNKIDRYINDGDTYQVNFTQRFEAQSNTNDLDLYFHLRTITRTPYSFYISLNNEYSILSFSPERFIQINNSEIRTSPIKGTKANNGNRENASLLAKSEKDKAENLMIVDLLRNDLSKVSELNSVRVEKLFSLETFENVHHLVSDIKSTKKANISELDAFLASFPGGSITGAPKKRAMEIIEETEEFSRDAYCGSAFYWNFDGNFDSNILIRTIVKNDTKLYCWGGGGITSSSNIEDEYAESLQKVSNITGIKP